MSDNGKRYYSPFPKTLAHCVEPLIKPVLKTQGLAGSRLLIEWESIVGSELFRHTVPEKLSFPQGKKIGGTLTISCENGFSTELLHMQPVIIERLAGYFGYQAVSRIAISHSWEVAPEPKKSAPAATALPRESIDIANEVEDGELRDALASLARTLSGQPT